MSVDNKSMPQLTVTGDELVALTKRPGFLDRIARACYITQRRNHEAGFNVFKQFQRSDTYMTPVFEGTSEEIDRALYEAWLCDNIPEADQIHGDVIIDWHFHPDLNFSFGLSFEDIILLEADGPFRETRPIVGVGCIDTGGRGNVVLLQRTFTGSLRHEANSIAEELWDRYEKNAYEWPHRSFAAGLRIPGYVKAEMFYFRRNKDPPGVTLNNAEIMRSFEYSVPTSWASPEPRDPFTVSLDRYERVVLGMGNLDKRP